MIQSKQELKEYIKADNRQFHGKRPGLRDWFLHNEKWFIYRLKVEMRYTEYYQNLPGLSLMGGVKMKWHYFLFKRLQWNMKYVIIPNTCGPGLSIYHCGDFTHIRQNVKIGANCSITVGTVFGHRKGGDEPVTVGDNCYFGIGCKILGSVNIGNNVTIGAHSVVMSDIPDNAIVAGCPAKVIRFKTNAEK